MTTAFQITGFQASAFQEQISTSVNATGNVVTISSGSVSGPPTAVTVSGTAIFFSLGSVSIIAWDPVVPPSPNTWTPLSEPSGLWTPLVVPPSNIWTKVE